MQLPNDSIGISDILAWRDCGRRFSHSMKRWTDEGEPPEAAGQHAYGSCIHDVFEGIERRGLDDEVAIQLAFDKWGWALEPDDLKTLKEDVALYRERDVVGVTTIATEDEFRIPLMERDGRTIYFRFKLDRLYQFRENPSVFMHIDYKSSKWRKTSEEVHKDLQMWSYNFGIHTFFPECERLFQRYDQLRYGIEPTEKSQQQREWMGEWLRRQVTAILNDEEFGSDGLLLPRFNEWCPWCPIMESCDVIDKLADFAVSEIGALSPDKVLLARVGVDATGIETYTERLASVTTAKKVLETFEKSIKETLRKMPTSEREKTGYYVSDRRADTWDEQAMREAHELLGDDFYRLVGITKSKLSSLFDDDPRADRVLALARKEITGDQLRKRRK